MCIRDRYNDGPSAALSNPPEFVLANVHGNLLVKFKQETDDGLFIRFNSLEELREVLQRYNSPSNKCMALYDIKSSQYDV